MNAQHVTEAQIATLLPIVVEFLSDKPGANETAEELREVFTASPWKRADKTREFVASAWLERCQHAAERARVGGVHEALALAKQAGISAFAYDNGRKIWA